MAKICEFGTAPQQAADGYVGIGIITGTEQAVLEYFDSQDVISADDIRLVICSDDIRLVKGGALYGSSDPYKYEFFVMVKTGTVH